MKDINMNRIDQKFMELRAAGKKAFIPYITAGDPDLAVTQELVLALEKAGADIVELGVPFSDPMADGPVIQAASYRALQKGVNLKKILTLVRGVRRHSKVPIALMSYYNPVFHFGDKDFVDEAHDAGVDGVIIPDLPAEEADILRAEALEKGLATVFFVAPTTPVSRMKAIASVSTGFIYYVSVAGVTGGQGAMADEIARRIALVKKVTDKPVCVGFGVSTPAQARDMARGADGVIVGSALVRMIHDHAGQPGLIDYIEKFAVSLAMAVH
ncbi:MAG: tryptophan synthase subunit alpha [Candidatus Omnitrophota bacterium]